MSSAAKIERLYIWTESNDEHTQYLLPYNNKKRIYTYIKWEIEF